MKLSTKDILNKEKTIILILLIATILKAIIITSFYQNVIDYKGPNPRITSSYGWNGLVASIYHGKYEMDVQSGLSDLYDLKSKSYRPPLYPAFLFLSTFLSNYSPLFLIFLQSIITSLVAYLGYKIARLSINKEKPAIVCLGILFFFPMNCLKSGTLDESPLMLVFLLASIYVLSVFIKNQEKSILLILAGVLLSLSTLTRYTALPIAICLIPFLLISRAIHEKKFKKILFFILSYILILSPWIFRNYMIYGEPVLSSGGGRILLVTQSKEFIEAFPNKSIDNIEREYLRSFHKSHGYLSNLDAFSLDREFTRLAISEIVNSPRKFLLSLIVKLKSFIPYRYFPEQDNILRDIVFTSSYSLSLLFFIFSIIKTKQIAFENKIIILALIGTVISGIVYFIMSRHLYVPMILMIIYSFIAISNNNKKEINTKEPHYSRDGL